MAAGASNRVTYHPFGHSTGTRWRRRLTIMGALAAALGVFAAVGLPSDINVRLAEAFVAAGLAAFLLVSRDFLKTEALVVADLAESRPTVTTNGPPHSPP